MQRLINRCKKLYSKHKIWVISGGILSSIVGIRLYYRGAVCRVDRDLTGETIVITGGSDGIGKETVKVLSTKGCKIVFGARDKLKSERVVEEVLQSNKDCEIFFFPLDLADK